jgi:hypothetical protein
MSCLRYCGFVRLHDHAEQVDFFRLNSFSRCPPRRSRVTLERERPDVVDDQLEAKGQEGRLRRGRLHVHERRPARRGLSDHVLPLESGEIAIDLLNAPPPRKLAGGGSGAYRRARREAMIVEGPSRAGSVTFSFTC